MTWNFKGPMSFCVPSVYTNNESYKINKNSIFYTHFFQSGKKIFINKFQTKRRYLKMTQAVIKFDILEIHLAQPLPDKRILYARYARLTYVNINKVRVPRNFDNMKPIVVNAIP